MATKEQAAPLTKLSHPDKLFWLDDGYTKSDLANFYSNVFPSLLPYVNDRILTLERCPDGMLGNCFYQKQIPESMPPGTPTKQIANESGPRKSTKYVVGGSLATQLALVNLGCIPVHVTGSRASTFPNPDWVCLDLDPNSGKFSDAATAGLLIKEVMDTLDLISFPKTSGSRGLHIFIPIRVGPSADEVLSFAEQLLARIAAAHPKLLTMEHSIGARGDRVYLDAMRNGSVQTVVSPYSVRRKPHAPVSTPLDWSEVKPSLDPSKFNIGTFETRMKKKDPWADFFKSRQALGKMVDKLKKI
ncbi:MAG TPA: non-homologous end-joining DNA ligase [Mucilaginibacter sp.]|jgi:bifunctional non-homologous end joining protein LigD|nr:non-homologous end-joining DNA ligase [Mucilaginibacter sp.]